MKRHGKERSDFEPCPRAKSGWHIFEPKGTKGIGMKKTCKLCNFSYGGTE